MAFMIKEVWAYIAIGEDGEEGVCGFRSTQGWMPMVCADEARVKSFRPIAEKIARDSDKTITLARFTVRTDLETIPGK